MATLTEGSRPVRCCGHLHAELEPVLRVGDVRFQTEADPFEVRRCSRCGVLVTTRKGQPFDASGSYREDYGAFAPREETPRRRLLPFRFAQRLRRPLRGTYIASDRRAWCERLELSPQTRVLDIGCGRGAIGRWLMDAYGCEVTGIEPHQGAATAAQEAGLVVHRGTLDEFAMAEGAVSEPGFDVVLMVHVLEHLPNPLESLRHARRLLRSKGRLVIAVPNVDSLERHLFGAAWDAWDIPRHTHHFSPNSLSRVLRLAGFEQSALSFESYSLLSRSLANRWYPNLPHGERRRKLRLGPLEAVWGFLLALARSSSAMQVITVRGQSD